MSKRAALLAIGGVIGVAGFAGMALFAYELAVHRQWSIKNSDAYLNRPGFSGGLLV